MIERPVIGILNPKGGVGMTTLATNLAGAMVERGLNVLLVDADEEGLSTDWARARDATLSDDPEIASLPTRMQLRQISNIRLQFDMVIVDGVARRAKITSAAIERADMIVLPVRPTPLDVLGVENLIKEIQAQQQRLRVQYGSGIKKLRCALCITQQVGEVEDMKEIDAKAKDMGVPILTSRIHHRPEFAKALQSGATVHELAPKSKAAREINELADEILQSLGISH